MATTPMIIVIMPGSDSNETMSPTSNVESFANESAERIQEGVDESGSKEEKWSVTCSSSSESSSESDDECPTTSKRRAKATSKSIASVKSISVCSLETTKETQKQKQFKVPKDVKYSESKRSFVSDISDVSHYDSFNQVTMSPESFSVVSSSEVSLLESQLHKPGFIVAVPRPQLLHKFRASSQAVIFVRHAERIDRVFDNWMQRCFDAKGNYYASDLNLPLSIPERRNHPGDYYNDPPLTVLGQVTAMNLGRLLSTMASENRPTLIFSSPALRCVQTAMAIQNYFNKTRIQLEPGLFEPKQFHSQRLPNFLSANEINENYNSSDEEQINDFEGQRIDESQEPLMTVQQLTAYKERTALATEMRITKTIRELLRNAPENVMLIMVGHAAMLQLANESVIAEECAADYVSAQLPKSLDEMLNLGLKFPYLSVVAIRKCEADRWHCDEISIPPMSVAAVCT